MIFLNSVLKSYLDFTQVIVRLSCSSSYFITEIIFVWQFPYLFEILRNLLFFHFTALLYL